ncbi:tRNA modification GTPase [Pseudohyphozyma bogoriensis]|nr:tRNA modification GTPase [Pseudohyphozyma bogoriensis]
MYRLLRPVVARHGFVRRLGTRAEPTIFAPATGRGKTAIAILRISGPDALDVWHRMTRPPRTASTSDVKGKRPALVERVRRDPVPRKACLRRIVHPETEEVLDEGIVLYFPASSALTAQPTLELHVHGSPALMELLLKLLPSLSPSFRVAEAGEFTRLAFEAGKMDLTEVEGLRDLVEADTEAQRKLAARQAGGHMRRVYDQMRASIIEATALVEALVDFGEDEGISEEVFIQAKDKVEALRALITRYLDDGRRGEIIRSGIQLAIIGAPNAGKSSLLNWLVADTAGLRQTSDEVEAIGVERAQQRAECADLKLCMLSLPDVFIEDPTTGYVTARIDPLTLDLIDDNTIILLNKSDVIEVSSVHLDALSEALEQAGKLSKVTSMIPNGAWAECVENLEAFLQFEADDIVLAAEELRYATLALGRIIGAVDIEEVLGEIFSGFCIGK